MNQDQTTTTCVLYPFQFYPAIKNSLEILQLPSGIPNEIFSISDVSYTYHCFRPSRPPAFDYRNNIEYVQMMTFIPVQITSTGT